ncbi:MAG: glycosyltransferase family 1 protein [bacterium]
MAWAIDLRLWHNTGIGTALQGLLEGFSDLGVQEEFIFLGNPADIRQGRYKFPFRWQTCKLKLYSVSEQLLYPRRIRGAAFLHYPHYNLPMAYRGRAIVSVYDLNHLMLPDYRLNWFQSRYARYFFGRLAARASRVVTISEVVKQELQEHAGLAESQIAVVPLGVGRTFFQKYSADELAEFKTQYHLPENYIVYPGLFKAHKNHARLLDAMKILKDRNRLSDHALALAGLLPAGMNEVRKRIAQSGLEHDVHLLGYLPTEAMAKLYQASAGLVFPSLHEGFGLPILEAMASGVPVACSCRAPLGTVAGDAAIYFDPEKSDSIAQAIDDLIQETDLQKDLVAKGHARAKLFPWTAAAQKMVEIYHGLEA